MEETGEQQSAQVIACAFTGHRPTRFSFKYDEEKLDCRKLKAVLAEQIGFLYQQSVTDFYTGCALGVDMWAGEAVLSLMELHPEVKLHCIVPFAGQERKWTDEQQARYHAMLRRSSETVIMQEKYDKECYFQLQPLFGRSRWGTACRLRYAGEQTQRNGLYRPLCPGTGQACYCH